MSTDIFLLYFECDLKQTLSPLCYLDAPLCRQLKKEEFTFDRQLIDVSKKTSTDIFSLYFECDFKQTLSPLCYLDAP